MARSVADAALVLTAMAGSDPADPATAEADAHKTDYAALAGGALTGQAAGRGRAARCFAHRPAVRARRWQS